MTNKPGFDIEKIKYGTDKATFERGVELYEGNKVKQFQDLPSSYQAVVRGTEPYRVSIEARNFKLGNCTCYLGKNDILCKHIVALALYALFRGEPLNKDDIKTVDSPVSSAKTGNLSKEEMASVKRSVTAAMRYIKPYHGPSRIWFAYQDSLSEGCMRLSAIISELPVSRQSAEFILKLLFRLDKKLSAGGVDDSDGTVGSFIYNAVDVLIEYTKLDESCIEAFSDLEGKDTAFNWESPLVEICQNRKSGNSDNLK